MNNNKHRIKTRRIKYKNFNCNIKWLNIFTNNWFPRGYNFIQIWSVDTEDVVEIKDVKHKIVWLHLVRNLQRNLNKWFKNKMTNDENFYEIFTLKYMIYF